MRREVSFLVIPHSGGKVLRITLSRRGLLAVVGGLGIFLLTAVGFIYNAARISYRVAQLDYLLARNQELEARCAKIDTLAAILAGIEREGAGLKRMLGMEKTPSKVDLTPLVFRYRPERAAQFGLREEAPFYFESPPTEEFVISKGFSPEHPGLDFAAPRGSPVFAPAQGQVRSVGWDSIYGNFVIIAHSPDLETFYGHLDRVLVAQGKVVRPRDLIGFVGSTGRSLGPHLHFEVRYKGKQADPSGLFFIR